MRIGLWAAAVSAGLLLAGAGGLAPAAYAHHSFAMFDFTKPVTLTGVVTEWRWTNPHAFLELDASDGRGGTRHFTIECSSPNVLTRLGWKHNALKTGDRVTVVINPLKNGQAGGLMQQTTLPDGRMLGNGNPPGGRFDR